MTGLPQHSLEELACMPPTLHRPFINVWGPLANSNVTEVLSGRDIDEGGPLEAMVQ